MKKPGKLFSAFFASLLLLSSAIGLMGCVEKKIVSLERDMQSAIVTRYSQGASEEEVSQGLSNLKAIATFEDGGKKSISRAELTVGAVNTSVKGTQEITVSYQGKSFKISITIVPPGISPSSEVIGYSKPGFINMFDANRAVQAEKEDEFINREEPYMVGTGNAFIFLPVVTLADDDTSIRLPEFTSSVKVQERIAGTLGAEILGSSLSDIVTFNASKGEFNFKPAAAGRTFRITQTPTDEDGYAIDPAVMGTEIYFEFVVVKGWNVYTAKDLSRFDNYDGRTAWNEYKTVNNVGSETVEALILQNDINLKMADFPAEFKTSDGKAFKYVGKDNDSWGFYRHETKLGESFSLIGNYFAVNAAAIPLVDVSNLSGDDKSIYYRLFSLAGYNETMGDIEKAIRTEDNNTASAKHAIKNIRMAGNTPRVNDPERFGGLICLLNQTSFSDLIIENVIANCWETTFSIDMYNETLIKDTRIYNSYTLSLGYFESGDRNRIENCDIQKSGGPLIFLHGRETYTGYDAGFNLVENIKTKNYVYIDEATTLYNPVNGSEAWFSVVGGGFGASLVNQVKGFDAAVSNSSAKTTLKEGFINLVCGIVPDAGNLTANYIMDSGIIFVDNFTAKKELFRFDIGLPNIKTLIDTGSAYGGAPVISGLNSATVGGLVNPGAGTIINSSADLFAGDYVSYYFSNTPTANFKGIAALVQLYNK